MESGTALSFGESLNLVGLQMTTEVWRERRGRWLGWRRNVES